MMIDHDDIDRGGVRGLQRLERLGAAIDGHDQRRPLARQLDQCVARRAVAFEQAVGDVGDRLDTQRAQDEDHQRRRGGTVDVVIAEHCDRLAGLDRIGQPFGSSVHVAEHRGIGHEAADRRGAMQIERFARRTAGEQQLGDEVVVAPTLPPIGRQRAPAPRLTEDRRGYAEDWSHVASHESVGVGMQVFPLRRAA